MGRKRDRGGADSRLPVCQDMGAVAGRRRRTQGARPRGRSFLPWVGGASCCAGLDEQEPLFAKEWDAEMAKRHADHALQASLDLPRDELRKASDKARQEAKEERLRRDFAVPEFRSPHDPA